MHQLKRLVWLISSIIFRVSCEYFYKTEFLDVPVDHFSVVNNETFQLRYLINDTYWDPKDGPIFFCTGNENDINAFAQNTGFIWEIAPKFKALIVYAEHRYYGISLPFGNKSLEGPEYFGYLTTEQALADFVDVVYHIKYEKYEQPKNDPTYAELKADFVTVKDNLENPAVTIGERDTGAVITLGDQLRNPVIAFGGSYGGMLAAWMRMKYPAVIQAALASSAPLWHFPDMIPCDEFNRAVTSAYNASSPECANNIRKSWDALDELASTENGLAWLNEKMILCKSLKTSVDFNFLKYKMAGIYSDAAVFNYPYIRNTRNMPVPANPVDLICKHLTNPNLAGKNLLLAIFQATSAYFNNREKENCNKKPSNNVVKWELQKCIEIVTPMCSNGVTDMFWPINWDFQFYSDVCYEKFKIRPRRHIVEKEYGGRDIGTATNIIFSNGKLDPCISGGVTHSTSPENVAVVIEKAAHYLDLRASNAADPKSVTQARIWYQQILETWIKDFHKASPPIRFTFMN